ncbi:MAG: MG2 domain-containing protein [Planctomycetota bacterium]
MSRFFAILFCVVSAFSLGVVMVAQTSHANPPLDREELRKEAIAAFKINSYVEAAKKGTAFLELMPPPDQSADMKKLVGIARVRLGEMAPGEKLLQDLVKVDKRWARDAEVAEALAQVVLQSNRPYDEAVKRVDAAVALFVAENKNSKAAELLFRFADYQQNNIYSHRFRRRQEDFRKTLLVNVSRILATYDRVLDLPLPMPDQVRALEGKANVLRNHGGNFQDFPRDQWPKEVIAKYDLSKPFPLAIQFEREIVRRFPTQAAAAAALLRIGETDEVHLHDYLAALAAYEELLKGFPKGEQAQQAKQRIANIKAPHLFLHVQGVTLPGNQPTFGWNARNIEKISLAAYSVDLFDVLRKVERLDEIHRYPLASNKPVTSWFIDTGDKRDHRETQSGDKPAVAPFSESGAYIVVASGKTPDDKAIEAHALFVVSRLGLMAKTGNERNAFFVMDAVTGKPLADTKLLIQRFLGTKQVPVLNLTKFLYAYDESTVPDNGLAEIPTKDTKPDGNRERQYLAIARQGKDYALSDGGYFWYWWGFQEGNRAYSYTDRPVYRPGQTVRFKHILRKYEKGVYQPFSSRKVNVKIVDSRGNAVYEHALITDEFGGIDGSFELAIEPPLGMYHTQLTTDGNEGFEIGPGANFRVEEYKKPEFEVTVTTEKPTYKIGDVMKVNIHGEYYFGGAVPDAEIQFTVHRETYYPVIPFPRPYGWFYDDMGEGGMFRGRAYWPGWRPTHRDLVKQGKLTTDAFGNAVIEIQTEAFQSTPDADLRYVIDARMVDKSRREIAASQSIKVTRQAFSIALEPQKHLYQPKDQVRVNVKARNPNDGPVSFRGTSILSFVTQREVHGEDGKVKTPEKLEELSRKEMVVGSNGDGELAFNVDREGYYKVEVEAPDPFGSKIRGTTYLWVATSGGELAHYANRDLEIVLDKQTFQAGETLRMLLTSEHADAYVLLTAEADDLYWSKVVYLPRKSTTVELEIPKSFQPNVTLKAALFRDNKIFAEERPIYVPPVESFLTVTLKSPKSVFQPREEAEIEAVVTDHEGKPVSAELSLGVVDASVFYIQSETRGDIRKFFYGRQRPLMVRTSSSYAFQFWGTGRAVYARRTGRMAFGAQMGNLEAEMPTPMAEAPASPALMAKSAEGGQRDAAADEKMAEAEIRSEFPDTVFWAAHLVTGSDGKVTTKIRFPDSLTTWQLTAIAATKETAVGEIKLEVQTKKNIIVRLQSPRFFVEKDVVTLSAIAHNYLDQPKKVRVSIETSPELELSKDASSGSASPQVVEITVPPGEERRVDFLAHARRAGNATVLAKALTDVESDAVRMEYPVLEYGAEKLLAENGTIVGKSEGEESQEATLKIPSEIRHGSQRLIVKYSPTIAGVMLESLPYLLDYPYGCTEQTMSRFLPAALTAHTLKKLHIELGDLRKMPMEDPELSKRLEKLRKSPVYDAKELEKILAAGVKRLADFQQQDGGWGWWKNDSSNPYISAYVVSGLATAKECGVKMPEGMLPRGVAFLEQRALQAEPITRYPWQRAEDVAVRVYMLQAIGAADRARLRQPNLLAKLRDAFSKRDALGDYSRALLALALHDAELREEEEIVLANIKDRVRLDDATGSASWGKYDDYRYWYESGTEATSFSLRALIAIEPSNPLIPKVVNWLLRHRQGTRWFNTKDTALACYALADYLEITNELDPDLTISIAVDGVEKKSVRVTRENLFTLDDELNISGDALGVGSKSIRVSRKGKGNLYWSAYATFFTKEERIAEGGNELFVAREYLRLIPKEVEKKRKVSQIGGGEEREETYREIDYDRVPLKEGDSLKSGDLIEVNLKIRANNNFEYLIFEDPKPAGCEPTELKSGFTWGDGLGAHMELRDERVAFFATYLNQGTYDIKYRLRAEIPGTFHVLPSRAECMYTPYVRGNGSSRVVKIVEEPQAKE